MKQQIGGSIGPSGDLQTKLIRRQSPRLFRPSLSIADILRLGSPFVRGLCPEIAEWRHKNWPLLFKGLPQFVVAQRLGITSQLYVTKILGSGQRLPLGLASVRIITTAGVTFLATDFNDGSTDCSTFDFHGIGTGTNAENITDTALQTELTTQYNPNSTRATGTPSNPSATVYRSVGTNTPDSGGTLAITEHGLFTSATSGAGTLWDRSVFSAINLDTAAGDSLQTTLNTTFAAGG